MGFRGGSSYGRPSETLGFEFLIFYDIVYSIDLDKLSGSVSRRRGER
jgi:hypothetical protein